MPRAFVVAVVAVLVSGAPAARAAAPDPRTEAAREHSRQGDSYYKLEKYTNAIGEYEQAYLAKPDPSFLFNIAQCHRQLGHGTEAIKFYRQFLKDAPPNTPSRGVAEKHIRDLEDAAKDAARTATQPPPPPVTPLPPAVPPPAAPPPSGAGATTPIALEPANPTSPTSATTTPLVESGSAPAAAESHPFYTRWWFWTAVGVVAVTGIIIGVAASRHDPSCPGGFTCPP
ncbi:MAG TPA: tetratricopeptide repeat protein [Polyangia bacterium]|nr:tetratricopeptide repeat protein [Polyangia bacterium]